MWTYCAGIAGASWISRRLCRRKRMISQRETSRDNTSLGHRDLECIVYAKNMFFALTRRRCIPDLCARGLYSERNFWKAALERYQPLSANSADIPVLQFRYSGQGSILGLCQEGVDSYVAARNRVLDPGYLLVTRVWTGRKWDIGNMCCVEQSHKTILNQTNLLLQITIPPRSIRQDWNRKYCPLFWCAEAIRTLQYSIAHTTTVGEYPHDSSL